MQVDALPHLDEHAVIVEADPRDVWATLVGIDHSFAGPAAALFARVVGCVDVGEAGPRPLAEGSSMPGFHVDRAVPPAELVLAGRHRFSSYALIFRIDDLGDGRSRVRAESRAVFPGAAGTVYRALVLGSGGHVFGVRRLLGAVRGDAERRAQATA